MLRITVPANSAAAKAYYSKAGDYYGYGKGGEYAGECQGKLADKLGLSGAVSMEEFHALCDNLNPKTGQRLTASHRENRRPLVDFTWSAPKSVALMRSLAGDERVEQAIWDTVMETMSDIEQEIATRVRKAGAFHNRIVGNGIIVPFYHRYSRPVDGVADPGDHIHACLINACEDAVEQQLKAVEIGHIKAQAPYWQAVWHARLANRLQELGYDVARTKDAFEITGISRDLIERFSQRTDVIEKKAAKLGITNPDQKAKLGAKTRESKSDQLPPEELFERWVARLEPGELDHLKLTHAESRLSGGREAPLADGQALDWALRHLLLRKSVVEEKELLATALKHGVGGVSVERLKKELMRPELVRARIDGRDCISTLEVLADERSVLEFAKTGKGKVSPLNPGGVISRDWLSKEQRKAVRHVWQSKNRVMILRGRSGTGKTTTIQEIVEGVEKAGHATIGLAVASRASRGVLREEAKLKDATTLAEFFANKELQDNVRGGLIVVDEASMMGFRDAHSLVKLARELDARLLLSGDRRQNRAVARGEPLAVIEDDAGLPVAELKDIRRQEAKNYREAVELLAAGNTAEGFDRLEAMGAIKTLGVWDKYKRLVGDYIQALHDKKSALVLCPTHKEGEAITEELRKRLKAEKILGPNERTFERLVPLKLTEAEREDILNYEPGRVVQFFRHSGSYRAGQKVTVTAENAKDLASRARSTQLYGTSSLNLCAGDKVRITTTGKTKDGQHRVENGMLYTIKALTPAGDLILNNGWKLDKTFRNLSHGYVLTSYAGQGTTAQRVLVAVSSESLPAVNPRQFYVDMSRGKESVTIYTDSAWALRQAAIGDERPLHAMDLVREGAKRQLPICRVKSHLERFRRMAMMRNRAESTQQRLEPSHQPNLGYGY